MAANVKTHLYEWSTTEVTCWWGLRLSAQPRRQLADDLKSCADLSAPTTWLRQRRLDWAARTKPSTTRSPDRPRQSLRSSTASAGIYKWVIFERGARFDA